MNRIFGKQLVLCLSLLVAGMAAKAQTIACYFTENYELDPGTVFTANIRIDSFISVGGAGLTIKWDPAVLRYIEVDSVGVVLNEFSGINEQQAESAGLLGFNWLANDLVEGSTLPDSSLFLAVTFEAIGSGGDTTSLQFTDDILPSEFYSVDVSIIPAEYTNASVALSGTSRAFYNSAPERIHLYPPVPNPFYDNTRIQLDLRDAALTSIQIVDQQGRLLYEDEQFLGSGRQEIPLAKEIFPQSGTYYCLLRSDEFQVTQKLIFIER